jgi:hypothetical protein
MDDGKVAYTNSDTGDSIDFYPNGTIFKTRKYIMLTSTPDPDNSSITIRGTLDCNNMTIYEPNGSITVRETIVNSTVREYLPNLDQNSSKPHIIWAIRIGEPSKEIVRNEFYNMENGSDRIAQEETYQQVKSKNPMSDCDGAAEVFVNKTREPVEGLKNRWNISEGSFPVFTADYGLYWWDNKSGHDMVLAELGWNNSVAQEIGLVRGAANLQGKSWGTILTWKYTHAPYLADGEEIFEQMKASYEAGAQYVVLFNYAEDMSGPYGTLQEQHFQALEHFGNEVVQNPSIVHGGVKAQAVLVLPENYGWGMRRPDDTVWGLWDANDTSTQIWSQLQSKLDQYGLKLGIVYDDPAYPVEGRYANVYYWNQTT